MLNYTNDSLTYWLLDRTKIINWLFEAFHDSVCQVLPKMHEKYTHFYRIREGGGSVHPLTTPFIENR